MMEVEVVSSQLEDGSAAGREISDKICERFEGGPDAVILFASPVFSGEELLAELEEACTPDAMVGCSSAGEFTFAGTLESSAVALALKSDSIKFFVHQVHDVQKDVGGAAQRFADSFDATTDEEFPHSTVMLLMDVLAGYGEHFLDGFTDATGGRHQVFGGGAADDAAFEKTYVFADTNVYSDAAVGLEFRSKEPVAIGVSHGWTPFSPRMTATRADGLKLMELDGRPAADTIAQFAKRKSRDFDRKSPLSFFLHHVLGIETNDGYKLRVPLKIDENGALICAAEVPQGSTVRVMRTRNRSAAEAARTAARNARTKLMHKGIKPGAALFFDCAATRLRLGDEFGSSVDEVVNSLQSASICVGCNTYGQFARVEGQFSGYHNCTAVVCLLPS